jgi:hypothetical protein
MTSRWGLVKPGDHIVCVQRIHVDFVVKIVSVDEYGSGIKNIRPKSLMDMVKVRVRPVQSQLSKLREMPAQAFAARLVN